MTAEDGGVDRFGRMSLVDDYDEAIEFYVGRLGFDVLFDGELDGETRLVHVGPPGSDGVGLWLFEAETDDQRSKMGDQTGGFSCGVFYTDDCRAAYERLRRNDVPVVREPVESAADVSLHFEDPYGNEFVLAEVTD